MSRVLFFGERLMAVTVDLSGNRLAARARRRLRTHTVSAYMSREGEFHVNVIKERRQCNGA